ncbi:MAG: DNA repair protein RecN [Actinobacteria bacterium]|nr:DNA repair protein RecN [Actinomycetota bacterium]
MLTELKVEGLGVIERAELSLESGSSVLTGETGAGKTLVVAALALLMGGRAGRNLVRQGHSQALVEGRFIVARTSGAAAALVARDLIEDDASEDVEVVIARAVGTDGKSKSRVNGRLATLSVLSEMAPFLVEIAGQGEHDRIAESAWQRNALDSFAGEDARRLAGEVADAARTAARTARLLEELRLRERARARELDVCRFEVDEIERAGIQEGEADRLFSEARRLEHADALASGLEAAADLLDGESGAQERLFEAARSLTALTAKDPELKALADRLGAASYEVADIATEMKASIGAPDPVALEEARERLATLARLRRKYGNDEGDINDYLERARGRLFELEAADRDVERLEREHAAHLAAAHDAARALSGIRRKAAPELAARVESRLGELALSGASFEVGLQARDLYEGGLERVEFFIAANPGEKLGGLGTVASGGELSRVALALHLLSVHDSPGTLVFDEVDAGVGGRAALAVGRALSDLAHRSSSQVLVVTHLPQVAAFADAHYRVDKLESGGRSVAIVARTVGESRLEELARMLAGMPGSRRGRDHAEELLALAARPSGPQ